MSVFDKKYNKTRKKKLYNPRKDCAAWDPEQNKCIALIRNECEYAVCPFFKTRSRVKKEQKAAEKRLRKLNIK